MVPEEIKELNVGDELFGFILKSIDVIEEYRAKGYLFVHRLTNMEVFHLKNDDKENFFSFVFKTPPVDECGTAHIIEHCILAGSRRYPIKDPFMELLKGSVNTFMNGMTYPDYTMYPAASPLEKDYYNLFKVYSDAVFDPLLRRETFWQEGIRLSADENRNLSFDGVVFNEMLGELSEHDSVVGRQSIRSLYPDTPYFYESGGTAEEIIHLNYRQLVGYYAQHYHPSNCRLFLYGNQDGALALNHLEDNYLGNYAKTAAVGASALAKEWTSEQEVFTTSGSEGENPFKNNASITINWATTALENPLEVITLQTLVDILLGNPGAPLYKAIIESELAKDISPISGMDTSFRQMPFSVGFKGINIEDKEQALLLVLKTLTNLVEKGIDKRLISNAIKRQEFYLKEYSSDVPIGFRALNRALRGWLNELHPTTTIGVQKPLQELKNILEKDKRYFEKWIKKNLLENKHRSLVVVKPDPLFNEQLEETINKRLTEIKGSLEETEWEKLIEDNKNFEAFENSKESEEAIATIPRLNKEDLPKEIRVFEQREENINGVTLYLQNLDTNGIIYTDGFFKIENLSFKELVNIPLLIRMLQLSGVGKLSYDEIALKIRDKTGGLSLFLETSTVLGDNKEEFIALGFRLKALKEDNSEALNLLSDILRNSNLDDLERLKATINDLISSFESSVTSMPQMFGSQRASASLSPLLYKNELLNGIKQWLHLNKIDLKSDEELKKVSLSLIKLRDKIVKKGNLILHICNETKNEQELLPFITSFEQEEKVAKKRAEQLPILKDIELFRIPSPVSFSAVVSLSAKAGSRLQAHQTVLAHVLTTNHLWNQIRGIGGAYGASTHIDMLEELIIFTTYRDPRIKASLNDYFEILKEISNKGIEQNILDKSIINIVGKEIRPLYPKEASMIAFRRKLYNITDNFRSERRSYLLDTSIEDIKNGAKAILEALENKSKTVVIGSQKLFDKDSFTVKSVKLPL
ncbi:MAG: insulinase family protein [Sphaerochaetaceae bacterium]